MNQFNLFEHQNKVSIPEGLDDIEDYLDEIWNNRERNDWWGSEETKDSQQRFIEFISRTKEMKCKNYVGAIHYNDHRINLLPKIFFNGQEEVRKEELENIHSHVLWWLSYCRRVKFPSYRESLNAKESDFFEVLIYLFSKYTLELFSNSIYQSYEEIDRELINIRGRINTPEYIRQNLSTGRWHKVACSFDSFEQDNEFNRIVKYVVTMLFNYTQNSQSKKNFRELLFILDEVSDEPATAEQCARITFNPMFKDFETVRDYCQLFLDHSVSFSFKNELKLFAFLLPMEYVFEDFVFGFIDKHLPEVKARSQVSKVFLDEDKLFGLRPDLHLQVADRTFIADTKYKIIYSDSDDPKKGISQSDLYQMVSYAIRFDSREIILFYPNTVKSDKLHSGELKVQDVLSGKDEEISIRVYQVPIISKHTSEVEQMTILKVFEDLSISLEVRLSEVLLESP